MTDRTARLAAGLALCADTERHLAEWERRKAALIDFVAEFADGKEITVGVSCTVDKLNPAHGLFWARFARPDAMRRAVLPKIIRARFEQNGKVLAAYDEAALAVIDAIRPGRAR